MSARLLNVDMLTRLARQNRGGRMPVITGGDHDGVHRRVLQNPTQVPHTVARSRDLQCLINPLLIRVADMGHPCIAKGVELLP